MTTTGAALRRRPDRLERLERLAQSWPRRASVRRPSYDFEGDATFDRDRPDYPSRLVPFADHPSFRNAEPDQRQQVLSCGWLAYNHRVITAEERVAVPAMRLLVDDQLDLGLGRTVRLAIQQAIVDEEFHTYMHMVGIASTETHRGTALPPTCPPSVTYRRYRHEMDTAVESWQRDLISVVWTIVSEVSVNAYLSLLSTNDEIQPTHSLIPRLHARDEGAHSGLMVAVAGSLYARMTIEQRRYFVDVLPRAVDAFMAEDTSAWEAIVAAAGLVRPIDLVRDTTDPGGGQLLCRDFSGVRQIVDELGLTDELEGLWSK